VSDLKKIYSITSLIFLIVLAVSPLKSYFSEWRKFQNDFNQFVEKLPQKIKPITVGLKQIWVRDLNRIDRCVTCHIGINDSRLSNASQPFSSHPKTPHDVEKFGCTICHEGQGLATDYESAHLSTEFWDKPLLPRRYVQSSCARCHINENLNSIPSVNLGRELVSEFNCVACHEIPGFKKQFVPLLEGIGSKVENREWLINWLKDPFHSQPKSKMPKFYFTNDEIEYLVDFLMSFKNFPNNVRFESLPNIYFEKKEDETFIQLGQTRFREVRCISCHSVDGKGGHLAVDLGKIASKVNEEWLFNYIKHPQKFQPEVEMPQYGFSNEEIAAITAYIKSEFVDWEIEYDEPKKYQPAPNFFEKGLAVFNKYNCAGCHQLSVKGISENRGPELNTIGSKKLFQIDWGNADLPRTRYDFIENKIKSPKVFGESTRMPRFDLSETQMQAITSFLLSLSEEELPAKYQRKLITPSTVNIHGEVGQIFKKYSCLKCHSINNYGGKIAPDLTRIGSQLQTEWTKKYFKVPYSLRPIVEERMPNLFISDKEIELLLQYFNTTLLDDSLMIPKSLDLKVADAHRGENLFRELYGCQSCHIVDGKGGYVGPPLDNVGNRLKPGWIYKWLLDPQFYNPKTIEPKANLSDKDALDITAFLMSLKEK
jgi:mono/diheme cytochrome c family protein